MAERIYEQVKFEFSSTKATCKELGRFCRPGGLADEAMKGNDL